MEPTKRVFNEESNTICGGVIELEPALRAGDIQFKEWLRWTNERLVNQYV